MKRLGIYGVVVALAAFLWLTGAVNASPDVQRTLEAGQAVVISADGCTLHVKINTTSLVKVKCAAPLANAIPARAGLSGITLSAGQVAKIFAHRCNLKVVRNEPTSVKVKCKPLPPDATVTVGPNGTFTYSGDANIHVGQTVEWTWGSSNHTVTSGKGTPDNLFCSPTDTNCSVSSPSAMGAKYRHTFNSAGSFQYYCHVHGIFMTAKVNVAP